jgi:hypothetical protein
VPPTSIVKAFNIPKDLTARLLACRPAELTIIKFCFQGAPGTLHDRIVIAVTGTTHADLNLMGLEQSPIVMAGILRVLAILLL